MKFSEKLYFYSSITALYDGNKQNIRHITEQIHRGVLKRSGGMKGVCVRGGGGID